MLATTPIQFAKANRLPLVTHKLVCNGIGPGRGRTWWTKLLWTLCLPLLAIPHLLGLQQAFKLAGNDHDLHYFMGGSRRDKRIADGVFLGQLWDVTAHWGPIFRPFGWATAILYFLLVTFLGWGSFKKRDQPLSFDEVAAAADLELA